eukprot:IDg11890t1
MRIQNAAQLAIAYAAERVARGNHSQPCA